MNSPQLSQSNNFELRNSFPQERWLESAVDGLLTLEGERFMLSIPVELEPNYVAILRPQIINELAELTRVKIKLMKRLEEMLSPEYRHGLEARIEHRIREELQKLADWIRSAGQVQFA
ncbi:MAG: hypothetical protein LW629_09280 [Burkholderiales bacterium]|nr:hypothetical protein [Burkholderiales bacterium]